MLFSAVKSEVECCFGEGLQWFLERLMGRNITIRSSVVAAIRGSVFSRTMRENGSGRMWIVCRDWRDEVGLSSFSESDESVKRLEGANEGDC